MNSTESISATVTNGAAWAAIVAAAMGCAALGLLVDLAERYRSVSNALIFYRPTGDLSGKTTVAVAVWLMAWAILHTRWKKRNIQSAGKIMAMTFILILLALIAVFPPFFGLFAVQ